MSSASNALPGPKTLSQLLKAISLPHWSILKIEKTKEILQKKKSCIYKCPRNSKS